MSIDLNPLLTLATIVSIIVAAWSAIAKQRNAAKTSEATIADLITDSARDMIETLNAQAKKEADAHLAAVQLANTLETEKLELKRGNAGLVHEVKWLRTGVETLTKQIVGLDIKPEWNSMDTKPLLTSAEVEEMVGQILRDNGYPSE